MRGEEEDDGLDDGEVVLADAFPGEVADAGEVEDALDDDGAAEHEAELDGGDGDDRHGGVPQGVLEDDAGAGEASGAGGADVVGGHGVDHAGPGEAHEGGDRGEAEDEAGEEVSGPVVEPGDGEPLELEAEADDEEKGEPEAGQGLADEGDEGDELVDGAAFVQGGDDAEGDGDEHGEGEADEAEGDGDGDAGER